MGHKYTAIAFTPEVKKVQQENRSRQGYQGFEQGPDYNHLLSQHEADFIEARDSFYMSSVTETDWPYVQHRGGPAGFMKVIDANTIGFADFSGNRQYVSTGNFRNNDKVALFFMDYPNKRRMKMFGRISLVASDDLDTLASLENPAYRATVERGFIIKIEGFDWNCPQHITPRFSKEEVEDQIQKLIEPLILENKELKNKDLKNKDVKAQQIATPRTSNTLGDGPLALVVSGIRQLTPRVRAFELRHPNSEDLPKVTAGSHVEIPVHLANGDLVLRHYSICSNPARTDVYEIAVLREEDGSGGSIAIQDQYHLGQEMNIALPKNYFELHEGSEPAILFAGGIGITPIKAMAQVLKARGTDFNLHYAGRDKKEMAFRDRLEREFPQQLTIHSSGPRMDIANILKQAASDTHIYICGPQSLMNGVQEEAKRLNINKSQIHFEHFNVSVAADAKPVTVFLKKSNKELFVNADESILDAMLDAGINAPYSCKTGDCKTCSVKVLSGSPAHHDNVLSEEDIKQNLFCPCVSRVNGESLTLDI
jgi:ferredoxin-NADP reductase/predicted pyridoxine 5'-phosphate oxidase superfamily flavin-nucleotide-binding protein